MFGELTIQIHSVWAFNSNTWCLYRNPTPPAENGVVVIVDASTSMKNKQNEVKLTLSVVKCMSRTQGMWNAPDPGSTTSLVDAVDELVGMKLEGVNKMIIISDGDDTTSLREKLIKAISEDGSAELVDMPVFPTRFNRWVDQKLSNTSVDGFDGHDIGARDALTHEYNEYHAKLIAERREAVVNHIDKLGVQLFVVGVGKEVKHFIEECAKEGLGIRAALIDSDATAEQVGAIVATTVNPRRARSATVVTAANATPLSPEDAQMVQREASRTTTARDRKTDQCLLRDGPPFEQEAQRKYVNFIINSTIQKAHAKVLQKGSPEFDVVIVQRAVTDALDWFHNLAKGGKPVAIDLIGGRLYPKDKHGRRSGAVFEPPDHNLKASQWASILSTCIELLTREPVWIYDRVPGLKEAFHQQIVVDNAVGPLFAEDAMTTSFLAVTPNMLSLLRTDALGEPVSPRVLYYKFNAEKHDYPHVVKNHRGDNITLSLFGESNYSVGLKVVWRGNSSAANYGGPTIDLGPAPTDATDAAVGDMAGHVDMADPQADNALVSESEEESAVGSTAGSSADHAESAQVNRLKRRIEELEEINEQYKAKLQAVKAAMEV